MVAGVVIAGGGVAAQRCAETLRRCGYESPIRLLCAERHLPYDRPPLSKGLLTATAEPAVGLRTDAWYSEQQIEPLLGARARRLHVSARAVDLEDGRRLRYDELVVATGSAARPLAGMPAAANVHQLRSIEDARALRQALRRDARLAILGAGFIGQEVAASARSLGVAVTIIDPAPAPLVGVLGCELGGWLATLHREEGVNVQVSRRVVHVEHNGSVSALRLDDGQRVGCDAVVLAVGARPELEWLRDLDVAGDGLHVDSAGRTLLPHVWAAGDVAQPLDPITGARVRTQHWEAAVVQATAVGRAIAGAEPPPARLPSFWSDQYGVRLQFIGNSAGSQRIELDGDLAAQDFTATFVRDGRPVAALLVNRPHELAARRERLSAAHLSKPQGGAQP